MEKLFLFGLYDKKNEKALWKFPSDLMWRENGLVGNPTGIVHLKMTVI
jgi:hypothetical protein